MPMRIPGRARRAAVAAAAALLLAACSKITADNFNRIQDGMTQPEVQAILGEPTESSSIQVATLTGTSSTWTDKNASITVRFVGGKVVMKNFEKFPAK